MLRYFSTYSPPELRSLSYRGPTFACLCRRSLPPGIGSTVWHWFSPLWKSENANADRSSSTKYVSMGLFRETKPNLMEDLLEQIQQVFSYFSTHSPPQLRRLSYRGTTFACLCRRSLPPGIGSSVWHWFSPLWESENADADRSSSKKISFHGAV